MERLKASTENSLKRRLEVQAEVMKEEMYNNEQKLAQMNLIEREEFSKISSDQSCRNALRRNDLLAEFMPMPGTVPRTSKVEYNLTLDTRYLGASWNWGSLGRSL